MAKRIIGLAAAALLAACGNQTSSSGSAADAMANCEPESGGGIVVSQAWVRAATASRPTTAAYAALCNAGETADALISVQTDAAETAEIHETMKNDAGVMSMKPVAEIALAPGAEVSLAPGGMHIMLIGLNQSLEEGASTPLTFRFKNGAPVTINAEVRNDGGGMPGGH